MIPKIIHQIWLGDQSKRPNEFIKTWVDMNPSWKHILWTESNIPNLVNQKSTTSISLQCISGQVNQMTEYHWNTHIPELNCIQMKEAPSTRSSEMVRTAGFEPTTPSV